MRSLTLWKLSEMKQDKKFVNVDWKTLNKYLPEKLLGELDEENNTTIHRQFSSTVDQNSSSSTVESSHQSVKCDYELRKPPSIYETVSIPNNLVKPTFLRIQNKEECWGNTF